MTSDEILVLIRKKEQEINILVKEVNDLKNKYVELNNTKHNYTKEEKIKPNSLVLTTRFLIICLIIYSNNHKLTNYY